MTSPPEDSITIDEALLRSLPLPQLGAEQDKRDRGDVLVVAGSVEIPGAALLAATAALRAGAGRVQVATVHMAAPHLAIALPEARVLGLKEDERGEIAKDGGSALSSELKHCNALILGPGMRSEAAPAGLFRRVAEENDSATIVLDAAALRLLAGRKPVPRSLVSRVIATPHAGEMAELWGCEREQVTRNAEALASEAARTLGVVFVLKGSQTFIAGPDSPTYRNIAGNSGLATAGSGDTLSGIIGGLAARGAEPLKAAIWGVWLHAKAGEALAARQGPLGYLARELAAEIPRLLEL